MTPQLNSIVLACVLTWGAIAFIEFVRARSRRQLLLNAGLIGAAVLILNSTFGFPRPAERQPFGNSGGSFVIVCLMFACVILGMLSRYFFYWRGSFSWLSLIRPVCISPIVLLPLLGTIQTAMEIEPIQVLSLCLLSFQNGFFWRAIFERKNATTPA